jgi:cysteine desulfurase / selenocysteine lyase
MVAHLSLEAEMGGYEASDRAQAAVELVYDSVAALIGARRDGVAIVENATRAWDMAFYSLTFRPGDRILTAMAEYASNYIAFLQVAKRCGACVEVIPNDDHGQISVPALRSMLDDRVSPLEYTGLDIEARALGSVVRASVHYHNTEEEVDLFCRVLGERRE